MARRLLPVAALLFALAISTSAARSPGFAQQLPAGQSLAARPVEPRAPDGTVILTPFGPEEDAAWGVARELSRRTGVLFGVETVPADPVPPSVPSPRRELRLKGATLGELLDSFVALDPRYEWREEDGIINLRPFGASGDPVNLLNQAVGPRRWQDLDVRGALDSARSELAIKIGAAPAFSSEIAAGAPRGPQPVTRRFSVEFPGGTLLQLLNTAALAHGGISWRLSARPIVGGEWQGGQLDFATHNGTFGATLPGPRVAAAIAARRAESSAGAMERPGVAPPPRKRALVVGLPLDEQRLGIGLQMVSQTTGVSIGFEAKPSTSIQHFRPPVPGEPQLDLAGMDAEQAVERLVREMPGYEWFESDGVIVVCPRGARGDPDNVLNRVVPDFEISGLAMGELPAAVHKAVSGKSMPAAPRASKEPARRTSISVRNKTVREILIAIVAARGSTLWEVHFHSDTATYEAMSIGFSSGGHSVSVASGWR